MRIFITLVKTQLNVNFGISALKYRFTKEKKKRWKPFLIGFGILVGVGSLVVMYSLLMLSVFMAGSAIGQSDMVLTVSFMMGQLFVLIFGLFYIMSNFYFSRDMNTLIPLPLKPYQVLGSKFTVVMINEYLTLAPILAPPIIIYGVGTGQSLVYWIKALFLVLASPVIPLIIDSVFIMVLMRFVNFRRSKDLLAIIGGFAGIFIALGANFFFQRIPEGNEQEFLQDVIEGQANLIEQIGRSFPPSIWATNGLSKHGIEGLGNFALFMVVSVVFFLVLMWLGNTIFYKGLLAGQEVTSKRKVLSVAQAEKEYGRMANPVWSVFLREWKLLLRTPVYVLNGLVGSIIGPFILVFMFVSGSYSGQDEVMELITNPEYSLFVALGGLMLMLFTAGMNIVSSTAVSREGQTIWISKIVPVSPRMQVQGKLLHGLAISGIGILTASIVLLVFFKLSVLTVIVLLIMGVVGSVLLSAIGLIIDVMNPKLEWNSPQQAMKQNTNALLAMLSGLIIIVVLAGIAVLLIIAEFPVWSIYLILGVVLMLAAFFSTRLLYLTADRKYESLEV